MAETPALNKVNADMQESLDPQIYAKALQYLSAFIQIKTVNPPGNERKALEYLKSILDSEGLESTIYETAPERGVLVCKIEGKDATAKSVVLMNHVDVVDHPLRKGYSSLSLP